MVVSPSVLDGATEACARNAAELLKDADLLTQNGRNARACALTILAFEEYTKAFLYRTLELGLASYDCDTSKPGAPLRLCPHVMTDHKSKHYMISGALMGMRMLPDGFRRKPTESGEKVSEAIAEADKQMAAFIDEARAVMTMEDRVQFKSNHSQLTNDLTQVSTLVKRWEDLKERALYVDVENGRLTEPGLAVTPETVAEIRRLLADWLVVNERFVTDPFPRLNGLDLGGAIRKLKTGSSMLSLPPILILCVRCERARRKLAKKQTIAKAYPKGSESGSPES
jgi:AbiV family abortive infection protein